MSAATERRTASSLRDDDVHNSMLLPARRLLYNRLPRRPPFRLVESVGIGVTSSIRPILMPARASARRADCAPGPGVFVLLPPVARRRMCRAVMPSSCGETA